jgi:muconolactone D-isomerase
VEFLVDTTVRLPDALADADRQALIAAARDRGRELVAQGTIRHIWRIPGALRNVAIWSAADATELHELLGSLPSYRYTEIVVTPLAVHPLSGGPEVV